VSGYEGLITWSESSARTREATDYLKAERTRLGRFRQEMGFLERRRALSLPSGEKRAASSE
jgi:hypothetical protein